MDRRERVALLVHHERVRLWEELRREKVVAHRETVVLSEEGRLERVPSALLLLARRTVVRDEAVHL